MSPAADSLPLAGLRVVVTRAAERADGLAARLRELGAAPLVYPTIAHAPPEDPAPLAAALERLREGQYDLVALTSVTAVEAVAAGMAGAPLPPCLYLAAVGPATAAACATRLGQAPALVPERFTAESLAQALGELEGARVLLPNADLARPTLEERLTAMGAEVERVVAYRTVPASGGEIDMAALLAAGQVDAILFTSGSTARFFAARIGPAALADARRCLIACIGPSTAEAAAAAGLPPALVAERSTEAGLVEALAAHLLPRSPQ